MTYNSLELQKRIMRRVNFIYWTKRILRPVVLKSTFLFGCLSGLAAFVSVRQVLINLLSTPDTSAAVRLIIDAVTSTDAKVQMLFAFGTILALWIMRDVIRGIFSDSLSFEKQRAEV